MNHADILRNSFGCPFVRVTREGTYEVKHRMHTLTFFPCTHGAFFLCGITGPSPHCARVVEEWSARVLCDTGMKNFKDAFKNLVPLHASRLKTRFEFVGSPEYGRYVVRAGGLEAHLSEDKQNPLRLRVDSVCSVEKTPAQIVRAAKVNSVRYTDSMKCPADLHGYMVSPGPYPVPDRVLAIAVRHPVSLGTAFGVLGRDHGLIVHALEVAREQQLHALVGLTEWQHTYLAICTVGTYRPLLEDPLLVLFSRITGETCPTVLYLFLHLLVIQPTLAQFVRTRCPDAYAALCNEIVYVHNANPDRLKITHAAANTWLASLGLPPLQAAPLSVLAVCPDIAKDALEICEDADTALVIAQSCFIHSILTPRVLGVLHVHADEVLAHTLFLGAAADGRRFAGVRVAAKMLRWNPPALPPDLAKTAMDHVLAHHFTPALIEDLVASTQVFQNSEEREAAAAKLRERKCGHMIAALG